ncbi:DUF2254 family protein [Mycobacterium sp. HUMS_1102779]|uniref:DUF2254 family protein n=1 Tax=Mycobacterium sp. HUMS_1102779 TaxID=3383487 RepID=UPI00389AF5DC
MPMVPKHRIPSGPVLMFWVVPAVCVAVAIALVIAEVAHRSRQVMDRYYPADADRPAETDLSEAPEHVIASPREGLLVEVDEAALAKLAARANCVVALERRVGDFVPEGSALLTVRGDPDDPDRLVGRMCRRVVLGAERALVQDVAFGFRQLVDIADRAMSPGINDPTTACRALDSLHSLLRQLATRAPASDAVCGPDGRVRLVMPRYQFADLLDVTVDEIWHYGSDAAQVPERIRRMLADLAEVARPEHQDAVRHWIRRVNA